MQEIATCVRAFDKTPDTFFLGVTDQQSRSQFAIKIITQTNAIWGVNAHSAQITDFEQTQWNNQSILFSAGKDGFIKAWTTSQDGQQLQEVDKVQQ